MFYSDDEYNIFSRQFILKYFSENNLNKIANSKITIVGMGGIGCPLATYLVSSGIKNLTLIDGDKIEKSNLNRQTLYSLNDIGKKKTSVAKKKLLGINDKVQILTHDKNISKSNLKQLSHSSIVIDTCDSWKTMKLINEYCVQNSIPLLSCSAIGFDVEISLFENKINKHLCFNCVFPNKKDINLPRCETVGVSGIATGMAGLIAAQKTINFLINLNNEINILTLLNVIKSDLQNILLKTNSKCYLNKLTKIIDKKL